MGVKVGFNPNTADVRINTYESDKVVPKSDIRANIARVLGIDIEALNSMNINSCEDIIFILFDLEENYGMKIENHEGRAIISFELDENNIDLISYLNIWASQKATLLPDAASSDQKSVYALWKGHFVSEVHGYFARKEKEVSEYYDRICQKRNYSMPEKTSDISMLFRRMIESGLHISTGYDNGPVFTFIVNELLKPSNEESELLFSEFYYIIRNLGIDCPVKLLIPNNALKMSYHIPIPSFSVIKSQVDMVIDFCNGPSRKTDYDKYMFERDFIRSINENYNLVAVGGKPMEGD